MPTTATLVGALLGLGTQMYSNALRKLPYMRHPWEHLLGMGLGAILGNQLVKWDDKLKEDLDKMLEKAKAANERRYFVGAFDGINWDFVRETLSPYSYYLEDKCKGWRVLDGICLPWYIRHVIKVEHDDAQVVFPSWIRFIVDINFEGFHYGIGIDLESQVFGKDYVFRLNFDE
ncbi:hypothetical protein HPP92_013734 [Vanilla planifolia]|uniref:Uncharacterized protein n=1 Tax=Vanilla planifolia TaxID=51239 RepID=A0A835QSU3_VANPL|nr:hypothetical protein HPP92_013734 [Vanilla planifolia]